MKSFSSLSLTAALVAVLLAFTTQCTAQANAKSVVYAKKKPVAAALPRAVPPKPVCFKKVTRCCWRYAACGFVVRYRKTPALCPTKVCAKKCYPICKPKTVHAKKKKCYSSISFTPACYKHPWLPKVCVKVPKYVKHCKHFDTTDVGMPCKSKCYNVCRVVKKKCVFLRVFHHPKFCAKLGCGKQSTLGTSTKPNDFVSPAGKFIKKTTVAHPRKK